jgi:hypothetical protein
MGQRDTAAPRFLACFANSGQLQNTAVRDDLSVVCQSPLSGLCRRVASRDAPRSSQIRICSPVMPLRPTFSCAQRASTRGAIFALQEARKAQWHTPKQPAVGIG